MKHRRSLSIAAGIVLCIAAVLPGIAAAAPAGDAQTASQIESLMKGTGLRYALIDGDRAQVVFDGTNLPQIVLHVGTAGEGPLRGVWVFAKIVAVEDQRDWPGEIYPWLLSRNTGLARGSFGLTDDGKSLLYIDKLPLAGLTGPVLATALQHAGLIVDSTYPDVIAYLDR